MTLGYLQVYFGESHMSSVDFQLPVGCAPSSLLLTGQLCIVYETGYCKVRDFSASTILKASRESALDIYQTTTESSGSHASVLLM